MFTIISSSGWPIWPLLFVSVFGLAILLDKTYFLRKSKVSPARDLKQALTYAEKIQHGSAVETELLDHLASSSALGQILSTGLRSKIHAQSQLQCLENMREVAGPVFSKLNTYLSALATIATIAPLMGLFGTVLGMIEIFGSQGPNANPQQLASGISMALYNTAFGLLIAIPALAGWRFLRAQADARQFELNEGTRLLIKKLYING